MIAIMAGFLIEVEEISCNPKALYQENSRHLPGGKLLRLQNVFNIEELPSERKSITFFDMQYITLEA